MADQLITQGAKIIADDSTLELSAANVMSVKDDGVDTAQLAADAVTPAKTETIPVMLADVLLTGAATDIAFTGLDLDNDGHYILTLYLIGSGTNAATGLYANADFVVTNYNAIDLTSDGTTVATSASNNANLIDDAADKDGMLTLHIMKSSSEKPMVTAQVGRSDFARLDAYIWIWSSTANITTLTFRNSGANGLAAGTRATLMKVGGV